ncbi:Pycsar system effector family protein [Kitasatospora sp. NBC_01302]|uniref:Pycsar system effector family protein n=1 Tax=Kitasatospora sp. NBC_01302 TaxID=2903575 RepID=UPI002E10C6FA|nr:DUF5706 domain-containing protein [Kitasatospora sp. NBC_01302]
MAGEIARTDSKASLLLALDGVLVAAVAALGKAPLLASVLAAIGTASLVGAAVLAVLVVRPRLDHARSNSFSRWAACKNTDELAAALTHDVRLSRLQALCAICDRKMRLLVWAADLSVVTVITVATAALLTVGGAA